MSKKCIHCGAELPEDASFCPHCTQSQIEKAEVKLPRLWRKKTMIAALCVALAAVIALICVLYHRPKTYEGGASVIYTDKDGEYEILVSFNPSGLVNRVPEEKRSLSLSTDEHSALPAQLGIFQNGDVVDSEKFFSKVESCVLEAFPNENGALELSDALYSADFPAAARKCDVFFSGASGTNELVWTLKMTNGDTIRLRQTLEVLPLYHRAFTPKDTPMDTLEDLRALLDWIDREVPAETIVDIYLPPVTYTGELMMVTRAVNLHGCSDGSGRTVFTGSLSIRTDKPSKVELYELDFAGSGGTGLSSTAAALAFGCTFSGWDIGALASESGMIGVENCVFRNNRVGLRYDTANFTFFRTEFQNCTMEGNGVGVQFARLTGTMTLDFAFTVFSGNEVDIDNPIDYPIDLSRAVFE